jgi:RNA polymerase sigma-70 factor (ECF subfamily)
MDSQRLRETIASAKAGQPRAFETLIDAYARRLYGYFLRAAGNHHDAEDLLSELSLRLVRRLDRYDERGRFDHWLFRIAANLVRDRIRRGKTAPNAVSLSDGGEVRQSLGERLQDDGPAVGDAAEASELSETLHAALGRLDATTRDMILLRYFGELSFKDLAETFDCPLGTALARVHRGLKALRQYLDEPT